MLHLWSFSIVFGLSLIPVIGGAAVVKIGRTSLIGAEYSLSRQEFFGGIPYAEPPIGKLRLRPPVLRLSLNESVFDAASAGLPCLQTPLSTPSSEDCLTINVLRPAAIVLRQTIPVMTFIYGGGYANGSTTLYNASNIVSQSVLRGTPVMIITFNYRLGPLGFPQGKEAWSRRALNLGLKDQLAALTWIQHNIAAFGGDKTKVTVFGESAGASSIATLFFNSGLETLARAAILESGQAGSLPVFSADHGQVNWDNFVTAVPACASSSKENAFRCLRSADSASLLHAINISSAKAKEQYPWTPTIDGCDGLLPDLPSRLYAKGQFAKIPVIAGTNLDEGTLFTSRTNLTTQSIRDGIVSGYLDTPRDTSRLESAASRIVELYPNIPALGSPYNTGNETFGISGQFKRSSAIFGDLLFQGPRRLWTQATSKAGVKTFGYLFTGPTPSTLPPVLGVSHAIELIYLFDGLAFIGASPPNIPLDRLLSHRMMDYWISFATSLDPNDGHGNTRPIWPQYTPSGQQLLQLHVDNITTITDDYRESQIDFINSDPALFRH